MKVARLLAPVLASLVFAAPARADDERRDYDAADPARTPVTFLHAGANVALTDYLVYQLDWFRADPTYQVSRTSIGENLRHGFTFDADGITTNLFAHPYHGALAFGGARSLGLSFWESVPYPFAASFAWELFSESQYPSTNDLIATSLGGVALGEMLHRLSSLALDDSTSGSSRLSREILAAGISPWRGANRVLDGDAWRAGLPPLEKRVLIGFHGGVDRVLFVDVDTPRSYAPSGLLALDVEYGDLLPRAGRSSIPAYDFFELYLAGVVSDQPLSGLQLSTLGLLHGFSQDIHAEPEDRRDNNVLGFFQSVDFQASDVVRFGTFGLGFGDMVVLRRGPRTRFRVGGDVEWTVLGGISSPFTPFTGTTADRDYNFATGPSVGAEARWDIGRWGQLGLRARQWGLRVVDGVDGREIVGYARAWYELDILDGSLGVGVSPTFVDRAGIYERGARFAGIQVENQLYVTVHP